MLTCNLKLHIYTKYAFNCMNIIISDNKFDTKFDRSNAKYRLFK